MPTGTSVGAVSQFTELSLVQHEVGKKKRHIPIRALVQRAGQALLALKPCFMMGPLSVAQYLPPGQMKFDLLVMDEASQIRPEDALGAIARASQVVIVGDPKQLPPTSFFDRIQEGEDEEDEETIADEAESILEVASWLFKPTRRLRWHYRSRHESLIYFSNTKFYDDDLIVFPSPKAQGVDLGVHFHHVSDGVFKSRANQREAAAVVSSVLKHMKAGRPESVGVVTMNLTQAELIERRLMDAIEASPEAQQWYETKENSSEPLFVKNLENVQGDERDIVFVSFTYGPDEKGKVYQRFGPINSAHGWRRLNVLFTRARRRVEAFSSLTSSQIIVHPNSQRGIPALKEYLDYASSGRINSVSYTDRPPDSPFEEAVANRLAQRGYEVVPQVGVAGFYVDIGVKHPDVPGDFIVGVECDGAPYHSGKSVRDRDRLRQAILEDLGWNIVRVWSTDWYLDPEKQTHNIVDQIELIRQASIGASREREQRRRKQLDVEEFNSETPARSRITVDEARQKLIELREGVINVEHRDHPRESGLLRKAMLEEFLRKKPADEDEFMNFPINLRQETNAIQRKKYLDEVLDILLDIDD